MLNVASIDDCCILHNILNIVAYKCMPKLKTVIVATMEFASCLVAFLTVHARLML